MALSRMGGGYCPRQYPRFGGKLHSRIFDFYYYYQINNVIYVAMVFFNHNYMK